MLQPPRQESALEAIQQVATYLTLFAPDDLIEIRAIDCSSRPSRLIHRNFLRPSDVLERLPGIQAVNDDQVEIFVGVCPRSKPAGTKEAVHFARCIWVDLDNVPPADAHASWTGLLPEPSLLVASSCRGTHAYWKLEQPVDVSTSKLRLRFEMMLQNLYQEIGSDSVWDTARVLRLPGTQNWKAHHHDGQKPQDCHVVRYSDVTYPLSVFEPWFYVEGMQEEQCAQPFVPNTPHNVADIVRSLERESEDRSKRDFAVVCDLLRAGLTQDQIRKHVSDKSKFKGRPAYLDATIANAQASMADEPLATETISPPTPELKPDNIPVDRQAVTHEFKIGDLEGTITVGITEDGRPADIVIRAGLHGTTVSGFCNAISTLTTLSLSAGVRLDEISDRLVHSRFEPMGVTSNPDIRIAKSVVDYVFRWLALSFQTEDQKPSIR